MIKNIHKCTRVNFQRYTTLTFLGNRYTLNLQKIHSWGFCPSKREKKKCPSYLSSFFLPRVLPSTEVFL